MRWLGTLVVTQCVYVLFRYAVPIFLRLQHEMQVTSTFKQQKFQLVKDGFDPTQITDVLYYQDSDQNKYVPLNVSVYQKVLTPGSKL